MLPNKSHYWYSPGSSSMSWFQQEAEKPTRCFPFAGGKHGLSNIPGTVDSKLFYVRVIA